MGAPLKVSAGTSSFILSLVDSSAAWVYLNKGAVLAIVAVPSVVGMMLGARIGARLLSVLKASVVRRLVLALLLVRRRARAAEGPRDLELKATMDPPNAPPPIADEQRRYARCWTGAPRLGLVALVTAFVAYVTGLLPAQVPFERLPQLLALPLAEYLAGHRHADRLGLGRARWPRASSRAWSASPSSPGARCRACSRSSRSTSAARDRVYAGICAARDRGARCSPPRASSPRAIDARHDRPPVRRALLLATEHTEFDVGAERGRARARAALRRAARGGAADRQQPRVRGRSRPRCARSVEAGRARRGDRAARRRRAPRRSTSIFASVAARNPIARSSPRRAPATPTSSSPAGAASAASSPGLMVGEMIGNVVREAPCSVLLVPRACRMWYDANPGRRRRFGLGGRRRRRGKPGGRRLRAAAGRRQRRGARYRVGTFEGRLRGRRRAAGDSRPRVADAEGRVAVGPAAECIAALARETGADLIIVGRGGGHSSFTRLVFGSTAKRIAGLADCPVLLVVP